MSQRPYIASNGKIYRHKETREEYRLRHLRDALGSCHIGRDGRIYERKETQGEYIMRKVFGRRISGSPRRLS